MNKCNVYVYFNWFWWCLCMLFCILLFLQGYIVYANAFNRAHTLPDLFVILESINILSIQCIWSEKSFHFVTLLVVLVYCLTNSNTSIMKERNKEKKLKLMVAVKKIYINFVCTQNLVYFYYRFVWTRFCAI